MLVLCDKCNRTTDARVNKKTGEPICMECGGVITKITAQAVNAMKNLREYLEEGKQSFSFPCSKCKERRAGLVTMAGDKVVCQVCGEEMNVSPFMRETMKIQGMIAKS